MSEVNTEVNTGQNAGNNTTGESTGSGTSTTPTSTSAINLAVEAVMDMIDGLNLYASITRGALGIGNSLCCEIAPSVPESVFMDKNLYYPLTLAINGKHDNLQTLSDALNNIMDTLTRKTDYTSGNGWQIVDITNGNAPRVIGREDNNSWVMSCDIVIKLYRKEDETNAGT